MLAGRGRFLGDPSFLEVAAGITDALGTARSEWLFGHNFCRKAGDGYASLEMFMWDPTEGLVAYATQQMFFSFPDGPPTAEQLTV
jgi:hypothetical protein